MYNNCQINQSFTTWTCFIYCFFSVTKCIWMCWYAKYELFSPLPITQTFNRDWKRFKSKATVVKPKKPELDWHLLGNQKRTKKSRQINFGFSQYEVWVRKGLSHQESTLKTFICMFICLSIYLPICLSNCLLLHLSFNQRVGLHHLGGNQSTRNYLVIVRIRCNNLLLVICFDPCSYQGFWYRLISK